MTPVWCSASPTNIVFSVSFKVVKMSCFLFLLHLKCHWCAQAPRVCVFANCCKKKILKQMYFLAITSETPGRPGERVKPGDCLVKTCLFVSTHRRLPRDFIFNRFSFFSLPSSQLSILNRKILNIPPPLLWDEASCLLEQFSHGAGQQIVLWSHPLGWNSHLAHRSLTQLALLQQHQKIHSVLSWGCD